MRSRTKNYLFCAKPYPDTTQELEFSVMDLWNPQVPSSDGCCRNSLCSWFNKSAKGNSTGTANLLERESPATVQFDPAVRAVDGISSPAVLLSVTEPGSRLQAMCWPGRWVIQPRLTPQFSEWCLMTLHPQIVPLEPYPVCQHRGSFPMMYFPNV